MKKIATKTKRQNKKHFILFNNGGVISATTPKDWARGHQHAFPNFNFSDADNTPTVEQIENYLTGHLHYSRIENPEVVICYPYKDL